jgi:hypothetical protein
VIWASLFEYGRSAWAKVVSRIMKDPRTHAKVLGIFD